MQESVEEQAAVHHEKGLSSPTMVRSNFECSTAHEIVDHNFSKYKYGRFVAPFSCSSSLVPAVQFNNDLKIPALGLGTWKSKPGEVTQAVKDAIDAGYRHIDCAYAYLNEAEVGSAIKTKISDEVIKREDLFVCSKLWNTFHRPESVERALRNSLSDLQLEYLDLYLIHFPTAFQEVEGGERYPRNDQGEVMFSDVDFCDTWKAMEELVNKGLVKSIGVSNFNSRQLERVMKCATIPPAVNQIEIHPYLSQKKLVDFCKEKNVAVTAYSPLRSQDRAKENEPTILQDPTLVTIASKYHKSVAQIIIRWVLQRNIIVIPKSVNKDRIIQNIDVFDFHLSDEDMELIYSLNRDQRANTIDAARHHKEYPFSIEF